MSFANKSPKANITLADGDPSAAFTEDPQPHYCGGKECLYCRWHGCEAAAFSIRNGEGGCHLIRGRGVRLSLQQGGGRRPRPFPRRGRARAASSGKRASGSSGRRPCQRERAQQGHCRDRERKSLSVVGMPALARSLRSSAFGSKRPASQISKM